MKQRIKEILRTYLDHYETIDVLTEEILEAIEQEQEKECMKPPPTDGELFEQMQKTYKKNKEQEKETLYLEENHPIEPTQEAGVMEKCPEGGDVCGRPFNSCKECSGFNNP